jgi:hypothetical protein
MSAGPDEARPKRPIVSTFDFLDGARFDLYTEYTLIDDSDAWLGQTAVLR